MKRHLNIAVAGGDLRQAKLSELLAGDGHTVVVYGLDIAAADNITTADRLSVLCDGADCVVLPLPAFNEYGRINMPGRPERECTFSDLLQSCRGGTLLTGGRLPDECFREAARTGHLIFDYLEREELAVANAVPTAEGAIQLAFEQMTTTLHGAGCLILGFGRIGRVLADRLRGIGAKVSVAARKYADLAWIDAYGYDRVTYDELPQALTCADAVFNTVPSMILGAQQLALLKPGVLVIDLASRPGGVDAAAAGRLGVKHIWALSLPGKVAPDTSGMIIRDTIYHILQEQGVLAPACAG